VNQCISGRPFHRQTAKDERSGRVGQFLASVLAFKPDQLDGVGLAQPLFGNQQVAVVFAEHVGSALHQSASKRVLDLSK
jgi:hypothetical protein